MEKGKNTHVYVEVRVINSDRFQKNLKSGTSWNDGLDYFAQDKPISDKTILAGVPSAGMVAGLGGAQGQDRVAIREMSGSSSFWLFLPQENWSKDTKVIVDVIDDSW